MHAWLRSTITPGQFSSEYTVSGQQFDRTWFSLFVPKEYVDTDQPLPTQPGQSVEGWVRVEVVEQQGDLLLLRLPRQTLENGQFITVRADQVRPEQRKVS